MEEALRRIAGVLLVLGALQFTAVMLLSEQSRAGYDRATNYISDLGVGSTAPIFNASIIIAGLGAVAASFLLYGGTKDWLTALLFGFAGIGIAGVGIFPENAGALHQISSAVAFFFGALSAIASARTARQPASYFFALLGIVSLAASVLFETGVEVGIGVGWLERLIVYPFLLWIVAFGSRLAL